MKQRDQFMRIAMAQLRKNYPFYPQRIAYAAGMWKEITTKKCNKKKTIIIQYDKRFRQFPPSGRTK